MLVYGDHVRSEDGGAMLARIVAATARAAAMPAGLARHAEWAAIFIEAGELLQGIADAAFAARGCDAPSPEQAAATAVLMRLAEGVRLSWTSGFAHPPKALPALAPGALTRAGRIEVRRPEGYAFYALYPEAYIEAAKALLGAPPPTVIGIRSIGTGLAALVAATLGARPPVTLRPVGHPFRRELALAPGLADDILADRSGTFAVVDEGPGLSGSSFGAVVDFLEEAGVAAERIHLFPGHAGDPGPQASARHRRRWRRLPRHCVAFEGLFGEAAPAAQRLSNWVADLVGPSEAPLEDISGGAWRRRRFASGADWPPVDRRQERRKFLCRTASGTWLLKFAGLGRQTAGKLDRARQLHAAGFAPEPRGLRHGFLVERWREAAGPQDPARTDRARLVDTAGRYIAFRSRRFPAGPESGASLASLLAMAARNAALGLGADAARGLEPLAGALPRLEAAVRRIETDNRIQAWEWLALADGTILKTDGLDHHAGHDLVGCQDAAWDIAGATVELELSEAERQRLGTIVEREGGRAVSPELLRFLTPCYAAFRLGALSLAAEAHAAWPAEAARLRRARDGYAGVLLRVLGRAE